MTLADRAEAAIRELGPLPACTLATELVKRKAVVRAMLESEPRFVHVGSSNRYSRWDVRDSSMPLTTAPTFTVDELAARWGDDLAMGRLFVRDFLAAGYLESADGNGRVRVTELGRWASSVWNGAADE